MPPAFQDVERIQGVFQGNSFVAVYVAIEQSARANGLLRSLHAILNFVWIEFKQCGLIQFPPKIPVHDRLQKGSKLYAGSQVFRCRKDRKTAGSPRAWITIKPISGASATEPLSARSR
jgi:hypothetical protein